MRVFFDTSALTKRYVEEVGSEQVRTLCAEAEALGVSVLVVPELISTLCRLVREGRLSSEDYRSFKSPCRPTSQTQISVTSPKMPSSRPSAVSKIILCGRSTLFMSGALSFTIRTFSSPQTAGKPRQPAVKGWPWWTSPCDVLAACIMWC
jgi:uncharacterized protein